MEIKVIDNPKLPEELINISVSDQVFAQSVRVHLANLRQGTQYAKTRADIKRTRKKLYKQKGTGGARHGDRKSPIFVGGGVAFAPKPRDYSLSLPAKMKVLAVKAALSEKIKNKEVSVVSGLSGLIGKTAELSKFLATLPANKGGILIVTDISRPNIIRAAANLEKVSLLPAGALNAFSVLKAGRVLLMDEALKILDGKTSTKAKISEKAEKNEPKKTAVKKPSEAKRRTAK